MELGQWSSINSEETKRGGKSETGRVGQMERLKIS